MSLTNWEEIGWIEVDAAGVAFCNPTGMLLECHIGMARVTDDAIVYQSTREDCPLPVEVRRDDIGTIVAARMCFTNDVDVIEGAWEPIGRLDLQDGLCIARDPYCGGVEYSLDFQLRPGIYVARIFEFRPPDGSVDVLGLSISWDEFLGEEGESDAAVE